MGTFVEILVSIFILLGGFFTLVGSIGLIRLPDFFCRLHGPSKATTLGVGGLLIASILHFSFTGEGLSLHELLITVFLMVTAPVSAQMLGKAALRIRGDKPDSAPRATRDSAR
ncbi:MAG: Na+/H+ antiporter subunit G [Burkholderiales bacterium]